MSQEKQKSAPARPSQSEEALVAKVEEAGLPASPTATMQLSLQEAHGLAKVFLKSGLFKDTRDVSQAIVKILAGYELGIGAFSAMRGINIIEGQLAPNAALTAAFIKRDPHYDYKVVESTNEKCTIDFYCNGEKIGSNTWEKRDAELAGLVNKNNWKKYPRAMYFSRTLTEGARQHCPHIFMGSVYFPEELDGDVSPEDIDFIEADIVESIEHDEAESGIANARDMMKTGSFTGNDYLQLGDTLGFEKEIVFEIKRKHETRDEDGKMEGTDFAAAGMEIIKKHEEING